jgi:hypothetical protein
MRTTLNIDDDVLEATKELASRRNTSVGRVLSDLVRQALNATSADEPVSRNGFKLLPRTGVPITVELIDRLGDEEL